MLWTAATGGRGGSTDNKSHPRSTAVRPGGCSRRPGCAFRFVSYVKVLVVTNSTFDADVTVSADCGLPVLSWGLAFVLVGVLSLLADAAQGRRINRPWSTPESAAVVVAAVQLAHSPIRLLAYSSPPLPRPIKLWSGGLEGAPLPVCLR